MGCVDRVRVARGDGEIRLKDRGKPVAELLPRRATVDGLEDPTARAAEGAAFDEALLLLPERGVHDVRIARIDLDVVGAGVLVLVQHFLKRPTAIGRAEDAALLVRPVGMAEGGDEEAIGIVRIDCDHRDHLRVVETEIRPALSSVRGLIEAIPGREVGSNDPCARADVDHIRIGGRDADGADRPGTLVVEEGMPGGTVVGRPPDTAVVEADVGDVRLARDTGHRASASGPGGADLTPTHLRERIGRLRAGDRREGQKGEKGE